MSKVIVEVVGSEWLEVPNGSGAKFRRDPLARGKYRGFGWVICPTCPASTEPRYVRIPREGSRLLKDFTGRCPRHAHRLQTDIEHGQRHGSGALLLVNERDPDNPRKRAFICANYGKKKTCKGKDYGWLRIFRKPKWQGLCKNCVAESWHPKIYTDDVTLYDWDDETREVVKILYSQEEGEGLLRKYLVPVEYLGCGHTLKINRRNATIRASWHRKKRVRFSAICRACFLNSASIILEATQAQNGNGQENGGAEKSPHGGARNVKWTPASRAELLKHYEDTLKKIKEKDGSLPQEVLTKTKLRGNKPGDISLDYAAQLMEVESTEYLRRTVLKKAREEREKI